MDTITGCWQGALISEQGGRALPFALQQSARELTATGGALPTGASPTGVTLALGGGATVPARLLEGASRALVALADDTRDPESGALAQLLLEARLAGDHLVGHWMRRDANGRVLASGQLTASRA